MTQEDLKRDTRAEHERLEEIMFVQSIMNGMLSLSQYKQILTTNYLIHATFEELLFNALPALLANQFQISRRRKMSFLRSDLLEADMATPTGLVSKQDTITYKEIPAVLGALYVLEGATLGGSVILKRLVINPQVNQLGLGFHYYRVYGVDLIDNWKSFCTILNQQPELDYSVILKGARNMFDYIASIHLALLSRFSEK